MNTVELPLSYDEASSLRDLLSGALGDMSMEIADTDNAEYRKDLRATRERLERVLTVVDQALTASSLTCSQLKIDESTSRRRSTAHALLAPNAVEQVQLGTPSTPPSTR